MNRKACERIRENGRWLTCPCRELGVQALACRLFIRISNLLRSIYDLADGRLHFDAAALFVSGGHMRHEALGLMMRDEVEGRPTKSAAGQARAEAGGVLARQFNQQVQFFGAVLKQVARALVALEHVLAELPMVVSSQGSLARDHALDF